MTSHGRAARARSAALRAARRALGCAAAVAVLAGTPAPAVAAAPDRAAGLAGWLSVQDDMKVGAGWSGSISGCVVGTEAPASHAATARTVNTLRAFAGLAPVAFDPMFNNTALAAALMMRAAGSLSHTPGLDWPCYTTEGAQGAVTSNLYLGRSGAAAMVGYVDDDGVESLGHRRWLLDPAGAVFGSGSTGTTNALRVIGGPEAVVAPGTAVAWPPSGWVPRDWIFRDWSLSLGAPGQQVSFPAAQVSVAIDGVPVTVSGVRVPRGGAGSGATLAWRVGGGFTGVDQAVAVTVAGAVVDGVALAPLQWTTYVFEPAPRFIRGPRIRRPGGVAPKRVKAGQRLVVSATVSGGAPRSYRWLRGGRPIGDARRSVYRVKRRDRGRLLSVRVTAAAPGGRPEVVRVSPPVRIRR